MTGKLGLAPVPASVERHLSGSVLGNQVLAAVRAEAAMRPSASASLAEPAPVRLAASSAAEELACFLDIVPPDASSWLAQMTLAIEQAFVGDGQRARTALAGLEVVQKALTDGAPDAVRPALAAFDDLLHGLCVAFNAGGLSEE